MDLFFLPNDPQRATVVSANDIAHFRITTRKGVTRVIRPAESESASIVAALLLPNIYSHPTHLTSENTDDGEGGGGEGRRVPCGRC